MKTYTFYYETDCSIYNYPIVVEASRLSNALEIFLKLVPSRADFYRLIVFNYTVLSNGKLQHRNLKCPHYYTLINSKCVRYSPETH